MFVKKNSLEDEKNEILAYLDRLADQKTVSDKMNHLCKISSLTEHDLRQRNGVVKRIYKIAKPFYPRCEVFIFGSTNNGFGTRGSDMDILFLPFPDYCKLGEEKEDEEAPFLDKVRDGEFPVKDLENLGEKAQLRFLLRLFRKSFAYVTYIPARCPILNFIARSGSSEICCDLSCRNKLVVCNTRLLKFFESLDPRIKPLVITLRFWSKVREFVKESALSSYAFTLMVIFFLQNSSPPVLPSVTYLMQNSDSSVSFANWEVSFCEDLGLIPKTSNDDTEGKLLQKFFEFYWNFEFEKYAVCVRTGKPQLIAEVKENDGFQLSPMCIQDPFNLSHNVGKNMKSSRLFIFKPSMFVASSILDNISNGNIDENMFSLLFDNELFMKRITEELYLQPSLESVFSLALDHEIVAALDPTKDILKEFYQKASEAVYVVLSDAFLMDCEIIDCISDDHRNDNSLLLLQCTVYERVWVNRNKAPFQNLDDGSDEVVEKERTISERIIRKDPYFSCDEPIVYFHCKCFKTDKPQLPYLIIEISELVTSKEFEILYKFLKSKLPVIVKQVLVEKKV